MDASTQTLQKLQELLGKIRSLDDPRRATAEWKQVFASLKKTDADPNHVANVVAMRSVEKLAGLIDELAAPEEPAPPPDPDAPDDATCRAAMRAFRKRLKLTRLDDESQINSRNPLSKGEASQIDQIVPPSDWPQKVWDELVRRGELKATGNGFYALARS